MAAVEISHFVTPQIIGLDGKCEICVLFFPVVALPHICFLRGSTIIGGHYAEVLLLRWLLLPAPL